MGVDTGYSWLCLDYENASADAPWPAAEAAIHSAVARCIEPLAIAAGAQFAFGSYTLRRMQRTVFPGMGTFCFRIAPAPPSSSLGSAAAKVAEALLPGMPFLLKGQ
eukprot:m51a1_g9206 hypothetical protein (106) ;mRNA; f:5651-6124